MKYFIIAGEASGDLHASGLMREIKCADKDAQFCFLGGDLMQQEGGEMVKHYKDMAYMGFIAVLRNMHKVLRNISDCKKALLQFQPDVVILVDYPSFNLRMAKFVKKHLKSSVFYYISPKIWAWKEYRIHDIKRYVDKMFTIFPFETNFYARHDYRVEYVGNPSVDSVLLRPHKDQSLDSFVESNHLLQKPIIAILAGSRKQEITACLNRMVDASASFSDFQTVIAGAPGIDPTFYKSVLKDKVIPVVFNQTYQLLQHAKVAIVNSGTATLETALIGTPQVVVYHVALGKFAFWVKNAVVKVKFISLVNIVAQKEVVKELIAHLFTVEQVREELNQLLNNQQRIAEVKQGYQSILRTLGEPGTAKRAAQKMVELLTVKKL